MIVNFAVLFIAAMLAGLSAFLVSKIEKKSYKLALVFAGAYLFGITIIHILPGLFTSHTDPTEIGLYILIGFFLQQVLEYFTAGAEHGHIHQHTSDQGHSMGSSLMVVVALCIHSFLEGSLLAYPDTAHAGHNSGTLLIGIVMHKVPAAFALMSILLCHLHNRKLAILFLVVFSLASPLGMVTAHLFIDQHLMSDTTFILLFALVAGNFLHISTTIVFESSVDHRFNMKKLAVGMLGALVAIAVEMFY